MPYGTDTQSYYGQTFIVEFTAIMLDSALTTVSNALSLTLAIDCCSSPTVISAPTPTPAGPYTYSIGDTALVITLSSDWTGDNSCCTLAVDTPVITTSPPAGLFTVDGSDNRIITVYSTDTTIADGTYTVTTSAIATACSTATTSVSYDVTITNPCNSATLTLDSDGSVFGSTITYTLTENRERVKFDKTPSTNSADDVYTSALCGDITVNLYQYDATSASWVTPDSTVFSTYTSGGGDKD